MKRDLVPIGNPGAPVLRRALTPAQFSDLAELPPELEWLANLTNPKTRRTYKIDVEEFITFSARFPRSLCPARQVPIPANYFYSSPTICSIIPARRTILCGPNESRRHGRKP